jgi:hypothetical protein
VRGLPPLFLSRILGLFFEPIAALFKERHPAARLPLRSPSEGPAGTIRRQAWFLGKRVRVAAAVKSGAIPGKGGKENEFLPVSNGKAEYCQCHHSPLEETTISPWSDPVP